MAKTLHKKSSVALATLLYLSFYLISPFFHFHEESINRDANGEYHSHLLNELTQKENLTDCHHISDHNTEHNHPVVINTVAANLSTRLITTLNNDLLLNNIIDLEFQSKSIGSNYTDEFHLGKTIKEKCVHSAGNVSPPPYLTA